MKIIGITGGIGSGKSRVLTYLKEAFSAVICQADHVAHILQEPKGACYEEIRAYFGDDILNEDKTIDRAKLGQIVFADNAKLLQLNRIVHPAVKEYISRQIQIEKEAGTSYFVLEAALLLEEHYEQICDEIWYIYCDEKTRRQRLVASRQYSNEKIDAIMASQLSEADFRKGCQIVIDNSGNFEDTCYQIDREISRGEKE